jgi:hypothetical protein
MHVPTLRARIWRWGFHHAARYCLFSALLFFSILRYRLLGFAIFALKLPDQLKAVVLNVRRHNRPPNVPR